MSKLISIGELLVDFNKKNNNEYIGNPGGAPANVCSQASKLECETVYLSKVGNDMFGSFLIEELNKFNVCTKYIIKSDIYKTSLAFVSTDNLGERSFVFYRENAADLNIDINDFNDVIFNDGDIFEFGSVALNSEKSINTHKFLLEKAINNNSIIAFDPNVRLNLWDNHEKLRKVILEFINYCDILKISDDEALFIANTDNLEEALNIIRTDNLKLILLTKGSNGADIFMSNNIKYTHHGYKIKAIDTTGAGDSFFGGFLAKILLNNIKKNELLKIDYSTYLDFACKCGAYTCLGYGAMNSMGRKKDLEKME